ncbi:MAG: GGDEF domain-containing phosphodiesterase [Lachnospiraceae bacterium]|nr:GGDEF domain-containing phosphodiesterase [Lachnospiraceae bacterium]
MKKSHSRKNRLSIRIALITVLSALVCFVGIARQGMNMKHMLEAYTTMMADCYSNIGQIHSVSRMLQQHQILAINHLIEEEDENLPLLEEKAKSLEGDVRESLIAFGDGLKGTKYESFYHDIFSGVVGYFENIDIVFSFRDRGDKATAAHYMHTTLQENITRVNDNMELMNLVLERDIQRSHEEIIELSQVSRKESIALVGLVLLAAVFSVFLCTRISDEMAGRDLLTGISNYDGLVRFGEKLRKSGRLAQYSGLAVSIRNFKFINQEYGSRAGDSVLQQYAHKLDDMLGKNEIVARNGGDNFVILMKQENVKRFTENLERMELELPDAQPTIQPGSRCGIYDAKADDDVVTILDACNLALNNARKKGAADQVWFEKNMYGELLERKQVLNRYHHALVKEEFQIYYQPKVDMHSNTLCGCEALVRWLRDGNVVPPFEFIPILEEEGSITVLDFYVFEHVCRDLRKWIDEGRKAVKISSNFSKVHLKNPDFAQKILNIVERYHIDGSLLEVELTESSGYEDFDALKIFVDTMKQYGISTSIDDFGTGYSSLSLLKDLNADVVKLDRSFLFGLENGDPLTAKLITNIVRMIRDMDRKVICEGVETKEHVDFLKKAGCYYAQGFLYDRPLPREEFEELLDKPVFDI